MAPLPEASLCCAQCEKSPATLRCEDEGILFCDPCSASLHAKKARAHHLLSPLRLCDECESSEASITCSACGGRGDPLAFCSPCSAQLHSKKARSHHQLKQLQSSTDKRQPLAEKRPGKPNTDKKPSKSCSRSKGSQKQKKDGDAGDENCGGFANQMPKREPKPSRNKTIKPNPVQSFSDDENTGNSSSDHDNSEDDESYGTKKYRKGSVTLEAFVVDAGDHEEESNRGQEPPQDGVEPGVQARIRKMLELGLHPDTPDIEAQQALRNAHRLLTKHNLQQADVLKGGLEANKHAFKGGMKIVELRCREKSQSRRFEHWVYSLALTVARYFDTQYFVQRRAVLQVVFYGIKQNVDCAAYAFAATFNRISKLSAEYVPSLLMNAIQSKVRPGLSQSVRSRVSRMSYRNGLVEGLFETVKARSKMQQNGSSKDTGKENKNNAATEDADKRSSDYENDNEDDDCVGSDFFDDIDFGDDGKSDYHESPRKWETQNQAAVTALVLHSKKVAEDFLKEKKIKVKIRKQESPTIWDGEAFMKGKRDSKTIDLGQKGITSKPAKKSKCV